MEVSAPTRWTGWEPTSSSRASHPPCVRGRTVLGPLFSQGAGQIAQVRNEVLRCRRGAGELGGGGALPLGQSEWFVWVRDRHRRPFSKVGRCTCEGGTRERRWGIDASSTTSLGQSAVHG
ncbi:hypothetical protein BQ8420_09495 [Nocardiopsis sp. JB363]|nr:hypothetical protein BQ8420_09495 [Nocardiopsis sp. JB363]